MCVLLGFNIQDNLLQYEEGEISANTAKIQNWLIKILNPGKSQNAKCVGEVEKCSDDIDKTTMCYLVMQVCAKKAKQQYTIYSLYLLLLGLQRYM